MNTPNKLTMLRIIMVPLFAFFLLSTYIENNFLWALIVFSVASLTDMLDGQIARKRGIVTDFGKFLDPLADKILVFSALIIFVELKFATAVVVLIMISREFLVTAIRLVAASGGKVIPASFSAKMKTVSQMVAVISILILHQFISFGWFSEFLTNDVAFIIGEVLLWISVVFSIISGSEYVYHNRDYIKQMK